MPIKINFLANTRDVTRSVGDIGDALSHVSESLDDVARDAARSGSKISDAYTDAARDSERAAERVGDAYTDAGKDGIRSAERLERAFKEASDATARGGASGPETFAKRTKQSTEEAGESVRTFKDEARSNLSEVTSSFDGSAQSITDLFQGTLGGVVADLGPAGAAAGAAAAVGIGFISSAIASAQEDSEAYKQRVSELAQEFIDTGHVGAASFEFVVDKLQELATTTDDGVTSLTDLKRAADGSGSSYRDLAQAYAGNTSGLKKLYSAAKERLSQLEDEDRQTLKSAGGYQVMQAEVSKTTDAQRSYVDYLKEASRASSDASEQQKLYAQAGGEALANAAEASQSYADSVQSAYSDAGSSVEEYVEKGVFNLDKYQEATQKNLEAIVGYQQNMTEAQSLLAQQGHDTAIQYLEQLGPDAAPLIDAFVKAPAAKQGELAAIWDQLGATSSASFNSRLQTDVGAGSLVKMIKLQVDRGDYDAVVREVTGYALQTAINFTGTVNGKNVQ